jgi:hypothetical protein
MGIKSIVCALAGCEAIVNRSSPQPMSLQPNTTIFGANFLCGAIPYRTNPCHAPFHSRAIPRGFEGASVGWMIFEERRTPLAMQPHLQLKNALRASVSTKLRNSFFRLPFALKSCRVHCGPDRSLFRGAILVLEATELSRPRRSSVESMIAEFLRRISLIELMILRDVKSSCACGA